VLFRSTAYSLAYGQFPEYTKFCKEFAVGITRTDAMTGRIEVEEQLQEHHKSNRADFYREWLESLRNNPSANGSPLEEPSTKGPAIKPETQLKQKITKGMRKTGAWPFGKELSLLVGDEGEHFELELSGCPRVEAVVGYSRGKYKYLNGARTFMKDWLAKFPKAHHLEIEVDSSRSTALLRLTAVP